MKAKIKNIIQETHEVKTFILELEEEIKAVEKAIPTAKEVFTKEDATKEELEQAGEALPEGVCQHVLPVRRQKIHPAFRCHRQTEGI